MRDVTDKVTGELDVAVTRGRGRPKKEGALTNAERQAAFRARRRESVTVTKMPSRIVHQVDVYDECRLEVDALRSELAEAHATIDELNGYVNGRDREIDRLSGEVIALRNEVRGFTQARLDVSTLLADREELLRELAELKAKKTVTRKAVTKKGV